MRFWHRSNDRNDTTDKADVSAWLEDVSDQLDDQLAENEVERGLNLYRQKAATSGDGIGLYDQDTTPAVSTSAPPPPAER